MSLLTLTVNGRRYTLPPEPGETLAHLLRERLHLTGTKIGCEEAECGSCTVWVDDEPQLACIYPAARAHGRTVVTIEGLAATWADGRGLHPLQEAFIRHGAVQCGFCIPGQIMTAAALLRRHPNPTSADVRQALKDTLCRCGGYPSIERAVLAAATAMRTGGEVPPPVIPLAAEPLHVIGTLVPRPDAVAKVTGEARYTDDLHFEGMLHARVRRAGVPHAIVRRLDVSKARALPGVVAVLTADDIPGDHYHGLVVPDWPILVGVGERVRYVGDALAIVAAETRAIATQALDLIEVELEPQPVVADPVQARRPDSPALHPGGNLLKHIRVRKGDMEQGWAEADVILEHTYHTAFTDHAFMEPECSIAVPTADGRIEVYVGSQIPYQDRHQVARALGWPE
ncbi:MAG: 2Fe-2S iron-sulfur cluster-binding protein, partial [Caldilineales bacterium]|nr:2Fe-2S iron-sulfur cluster-binding protein [Caldilineales bacterium]